jgi:hypothetical protein
MGHLALATTDWTTAMPGHMAWRQYRADQEKMEALLQCRITDREVSCPLATTSLVLGGADLEEREMAGARCRLSQMLAATGRVGILEIAQVTGTPQVSLKLQPEALLERKNWPWIIQPS